MLSPFFKYNSKYYVGGYCNDLVRTCMEPGEKRERGREKIRESRKDFILELVVERYALEGFVAIRNEIYTFFTVPC